MEQISIIIPVYNTAESELRQCMDSVYAQTYRDLQIILVDDGSSPDTAALCDELAKQDSRVLTLHQPNLGVSVARNNGIDHATGTYILFLDSDDCLHPSLCETLAKRFVSTTADFLMYGHLCFRDSEEVPHLLGRDCIFEKADITRILQTILSPNGELLIIAPGATWGKMYRTSYLRDHHLYFTPGIKRMQDSLFAVGVFHYANSVEYVDIPGYRYRISAQSVCNRYQPDIFQTMEQVIRALSDAIEHLEPELSPLINNITVTILESEYFRLYFRHPASPLPARERKHCLKKLLQASPYKESIAEVHIPALSPRFRIMTFLFRHHMTDLLWFLLDLEDFMNHLSGKGRRI